MFIIAGACQSNYEDLIKAGANFASSPKRINIHALDPAIIAVSISKTENNKEYTVLAAADVEKELRITQGKKIQITGIITRPQKDKMELEMLKDGKIELTEWKFIE